MKAFFICGEDSGDALGESLINALRSVRPETECFGVGGPRMKVCDFEQLLPMDQISVAGLWEVLPKLYRLVRINSALVEEIESRQPDVVITIDFPDFNFKLAQSLKKRGVYKGKIVHYVSPSVWAWRAGRAKKIAGFLDGMLCLFPMEPKYYEQHGLKAIHVGHPLIESKAHEANGKDFRQENDIADDVKTLGLFFGSREMEFKAVSGVIKEAARLVNEVVPDVRFIVPSLPDKEYEVQQLLVDFPLPVHVSANPNVKWSAFKACDVAICVSGTAALELSYVGVPHVIVYKTNPITGIILRFLVKVKYAHLTNILFDKLIVPEFLQGKCSAEPIAEKVIDLLRKEDARNAQKEEFAKLGSLLGKGESMQPSYKAAEFIFNIVEGRC